MKRVLVTGATGFLGWHLCAHLLEQGYQVRGQGRDQEALARLGRLGVEPWPVDFQQPGWASAATAGCDAVVHSGGLSSPWGTRDEFERANVASTSDLLSCCLHTGARVVLISSPSLYVTNADRLGIKESDPLPPRFINRYAASKYRAEQAVAQASVAGLETVILRPQAIFGPGDTSLLPRFLRASAGFGIPEFKPDGPLVDITYVVNVCHAIRLALETAHVGKTYHISNGEPVRVLPFLKGVFERAHLPLRVQKRPAALVDAVAAAAELVYGAVRSLGEPPLTRYAVSVLRYDRTLDLSAATADLGYRPLVTLDEGVQAYVQSLG